MSKVTGTYWILMGLFVVSLAGHVLFLGGGANSLATADSFSYEQSLEITGSLGAVNLMMYIPAPQVGLEIRDESIEAADLGLEIREGTGGRLLVAGGTPAGRRRQIRYRAHIGAKAMAYNLAGVHAWETAAAADSQWLAATDVIQVGHADVTRLLAKLLQLDETKVPADHRLLHQQLAAAGVDPVQALRIIYEHAHLGIEPATFSGTTDALTALRLAESSCGGKSRLMVALCRRLGIPARLVGGVIMNQAARKRTHHLWVEARIDGIWVPFDPLNGHFAFKPGRFLRLYTGDLPLIRHSRGLTFDYGFSSTLNRVPVIWLGPDRSAADAAPPTGAAAGAVIPLLGRHQYSAIMLAPFCLLMIVFARQVVGVESIGTFLPILLGFSLVQAAWLVTGVQMVLAIMMGVIMRFLLTRLNVLHVPRAAIMITFVVLMFLVFSAGMARFDSLAGIGAVVLPIAALAMAVEKFTLVAMDKGTVEALQLLGQTLLLAVGCRAIMVTPFFQNVIVAFPEILLMILAMIVLLGSYRGLRWRELWRFRRVPGGAGA